MKTLLICPLDRPGVASLAEAAPLSNLPILGKSLVEHWIEHQALLGARQIRILAADRPDQVRRLVGQGAKWGVQIEVLPERSELTPDQARAKYAVSAANGWLQEPTDVVLMDYLPRSPEQKLFDSYSGWFLAVNAWLPQALTPDRIGLKQPKPGIWVGRRSRVAASAKLEPPCWLGENVSVGPGSVVGPMAILEDRVYVEGPARIEHSVVGPETFLGTLTQLEHSLALGNILIDWQSGSAVKVPDPFVLSSLRPRPGVRKRAGRASRMAALVALALTFPIGLAAVLKSLLSGVPAFRRRLAVRPLDGAVPNTEKPVEYYELESASGWLKRWPQLLNVARGEFTWVGNRPLNADQAGRLTTDFERLWLSAPTGIISLADSLGCLDSFDDETRAHSSFYAVQCDRGLDWTILNRVWFAPSRRPTGEKDRVISSSLVSTSLAEAEE